MEYSNIFDRYARQINNMQSPGMGDNRVAILVNDVLYTEIGSYWSDEDKEKYVNTNLIPWSFLNGIYCKGMVHGNFGLSREYDSVDNIVRKSEDDYSLDATPLNYVNAVMAAIYDYKKNSPEIITLIAYIADADACEFCTFKDEEEFSNVISQDLELLEGK